MPAINYLNHDRGIQSWLLTLDHKRIALMYLALTTVALVLGGVFAMALRFEHLTPGPTIMGANTYNRMFTMHGIVMIFLFMIPAIPGIFGNFCLPLMLGAKDVAFPKLNLLSVYVYAVGAALALYAIASGGIDSGWTFYAPYSLTTPATLFPALLGIFILGFSSILTGLNFIVTDAHPAGAGDELDAHAPVRVGHLRHRGHPGAGHPGHRPDLAAGGHRAGVRLRLLRPQPRAATRCCSSTCSGSTRTRPSTSWCCRRSR